MPLVPILRVTQVPALAPGRAWRGWTALYLAGLSTVGGCYTTQPLMSAPTPGTTVVLSLTDRARVQLGDQIGPSASRVEGVVQAQNDTAFVLHVSSVQYLNGQSNKWSGEPLTVPTSLVGQARVRQFSRARTTAVGVGIVAAIVTLFAKTNFLGSAGPDKQTPPPPPPVS